MWLSIVVSIETCHPGGPRSIPASSKKALFSKKYVSDYVVNVQLTSSLRISERENSQIQELAPCGVGNTDIDLNNELDASFVELLSPKSLRKRTDGRLRQTSFTTYSAKQKKRGILFSKKVLVKLFFFSTTLLFKRGS